MLNQNIPNIEQKKSSFVSRLLGWINKRNSKNKFIVFVLAFAIIGGLVIYRSFAATNLIGADGEFNSVTPTRILDTRSANGVTTTTPISAGGTITVQIAGKGGIPATGVKSVVVNLSAVNPTAVGGLTVWPTGTTRPTAGSITFVAGQSINNQIIAPVAADGKIQIYNPAGDTHVVIETIGYISNSSGVKGSRFQSVTQTRILDTRSANGVTTTTPISAGGTITVQIAGKGGIPATGVKSVVVNLSAVSPTAAGGLIIWPSGATRPAGSVTSFAVNKNITNQAIVPVGSDGKIQIYNSAGNTHATLDVVGYYALPKSGTETSQDGRVTNIPSSRVFDSRGLAPLESQKQRSVHVLGLGGIPQTDVKAVIVNLSSLGSTAASSLNAWPSGTTRPVTSNISTSVGITITNQVVIPVGSYGNIQVYNSLGNSHFVFDVVGYISSNPGAMGSFGNQRFPGDPNPTVTGKAYWGASISQDINGNSDPTVRFEVPAGKSLAVRRTFWQWNKPKMFETVKADIVANRLPFVSVKSPGQWAEVASGKYDAELDSMLKTLDASGGPVWFAINHEPENDSTGTTPIEKCEKDPVTFGVCLGTPADWRAMQIKVRERMYALNTKNIAFMPILMSWTWDSRSGRTPTDWWVNGIWDAYISDHYEDRLTAPIASSTAWTNYVAFASARKMPYGTAEWGVRSGGAPGVGFFATTPAATPCVFVPRPTTVTNENLAKQRHQEFWDWGFANKKDVIVQSYYDACINSGLNPWTLGGTQLTQFQKILKDDTRVQRINQL